MTADDLDALYRAMVDAENDAYLDDENYGIALDRLYASRDAYAAAVAASL